MSKFVEVSYAVEVQIIDIFFFHFWSIFLKRVILNKYKTFSVLIYSYINTSGTGETRNCVETRRQKGGVFSHNFEFSQFPRVLI
jgi:hypothetical protein